MKETTYKHTEVGVIPSDWDIDYIKNLAVIKTGSRNTQDRIENGLYPFFVRSQTVERINSYSFDGEAVLTAGDGVGVGKVIHYVNEKFDCHQRVYRISDFSEKLNGYFFYLYFSNNFLNRIMQMTAKSSVDSVRMDMIANMQIPLPPTKAEQTAIATALSDADALINGLEKLITKKRNIKQGAMQKLLKPKEGWEVKKLGEVIQSFQLGGNYPNNQRVTSFPLIKMGNIQRGYIATEKLEYIPEDYKPNEKDRLHFGDILFNTRNTLDLVGKVTIWRNELPEAYYNSNLMRLKFNPLYISSNFFMCYVLNAKYSISRLKDIATGTTSVAAIYTRDLLKLDIPFPSLEEQTQIATILSDMDNEISALETKLEKYRSVKLGMMQNLLTGKIRLV